MSIPVETIFAMLAIEMFRALAQPEGLRPPGAGTVFAVTAGWVAFQYVLAASLARRTRGRLRRARGSTVDIVEDFRFRLVIHRLVLVVLCFAHIYFTRWPTFVEEGLGLPAWSVLDDVAAMAPFVAALAAGWIATYRADKMLSRRPWGMGEYVWFQARYSLLLVLLPWLILKGIDDSRELWPERLQKLSESTAVDIAAFAVLIAAAAVFLPLFLKLLFRAVPMPPSEIRSRLEACLLKAGLRFRDILVWRMERARILNAGVMGILPRYRYVLFSDALLDALSPTECEAVLGHEIGHTKYRHVLVYLVFTLGFVALAYNAMALLPPGFRADFLVGMPVVAILVGVYFRLIFGYLSRAFEREADVYAAELLGTPVPLILALEKIALMSGDVRSLSSWRHHSVAERVRYLSEVGYDAGKQERYHKRVRLMTWAVAGMVALLFAGALWTSLREPEGLPAKIARFEEMTRRRPRKAHAWMRLGELRAEDGDAEGALTAFGEALARSPSSESIGRARKGLARLDVPEARKRYTLASAYLRAGRPDLAVNEARATVAADPDDAEGRLMLARIVLDRTNGELFDPEEAARHAVRALVLEKTGAGGAAAGTYETVARAYLEGGDHPAARRYVEEGLERHPGDAALGALLERVRGGD